MNRLASGFIAFMMLANMLGWFTGDPFYFTVWLASSFMALLLFMD